MGFLYKAFIRNNTPELRAKLEDLGYTNGAWETPRFHYPYLSIWPNPKFGLFKGEGFYITEDDYRLDGKVWEYKPKEDVIDYGDNEELFLALAALRDDTPINNFYWFNHRLVKCEKLEPKNLSFSTMRYLLKCRCVDDSFICFCTEESYLKKATVKEIIEHFKNK